VPTDTKKMVKEDRFTIYSLSPLKLRSMADINLHIILSSLILLLNELAKCRRTLHCVCFQDSSRPEIPKQYFSFADVSVTLCESFN